MSKQRTQQKRSQVENKNPLQSDLGNTTLQDFVVSKVAGIAAQEVDGVRMGGGASESVGGVLDTITGGRSGGSQTSGVSVEVSQEEAAIDLTMTVEYGKPKKVALTACMRKLLSILGAILRNRSPWQPRLVAAS